jgi:restriction endonuclease S subunit
MCIRIHDQNRLLPTYLEWFINLNETQQMLARFSHVSRTRTVGTKALKDLEIVLPSRERQRKIVETHTLKMRIGELEAELRRKRLQYTENALLKYARE